MCINIFPSCMYVLTCDRGWCGTHTAGFQCQVQMQIPMSQEVSEWLIKPTQREIQARDLKFNSSLLLFFMFRTFIDLFWYVNSLKICVKILFFAWYFWNILKGVVTSDRKWLNGYYKIKRYTYLWCLNVFVSWTVYFLVFDRFIFATNFPLNST